MQEHKGFHMVTEALAVFVTVPFALALAKHQGPLTPEHRSRLRLYAVTTLAVDGYLLWKWMTR